MYVYNGINFYRGNFCNFSLIFSKLKIIQQNYSPPVPTLKFVKINLTKFIFCMFEENIGVAFYSHWNVIEKICKTPFVLVLENVMAFIIVKFCNCIQPWAIFSHFKISYTMVKDDFSLSGEGGVDLAWCLLILLNIITKIICACV